jgi:hypothetical protein
MKLIIIFSVLALFAGAAVMLLSMLSPKVTWAPAQATGKKWAEITPDQWNALASKRIFFAHMSVGYDLLSGIKDLQQERPELKFSIVESGESLVMEKPVLAHAKLGHNGAPLRKFESFRRLMEGFKDGPPDIAFMKLCYVDIRSDTPVEKVFASYKSMMDGLAIKYPRTRFAHLTVPLCSPTRTWKDSLKAPIKRLLGKPDVITDNLRRDEFNHLLKKAFTSTSTVIDIAGAESTGPMGSATVVRGGRPVPYLLESYTTDGGHLNDTGRRHVAESLLATLASNQ